MGRGDAEEKTAATFPTLVAIDSATVRRLLDANAFVAS
jgi:hypothetical protein